MLCAAPAAAGAAAAFVLTKAVSGSRFRIARSPDTAANDDLAVSPGST